ncbi:hypothetical protein Tco_1244910 [Tanacetum coccineum]
MWEGRTAVGNLNIDKMLHKKAHENRVMYWNKCALVVSCRRSGQPIYDDDVDDYWHFNGVNTSTEASRSKPRSNTKKNRILPAKSERKKKVEDHPKAGQIISSLAPICTLISMDDMMKSSANMLLSKASKSKSWLWASSIDSEDLGKYQAKADVGIFVGNCLAGRAIESDNEENLSLRKHFTRPISMRCIRRWAPVCIISGTRANLIDYP